MLKDNKGITIISLVITIIILVIIASVATVSGMGAIDYINFNNAKVQIQTMQSNVNTWYEEYKSIDDKSSWLDKYGKDIDTSYLDANVVANTLYDEETGKSDASGYKYFSAEDIKNDLDIDGISYNFLVNIEKRSVRLYGGIEYQGKTYYSAEDFGINIVEFEEMSGNISFNTTIDNNFIVVSGIEFPDNININKFKVQYKIDESDYWTTLTSDMNKDDKWYIEISKEGNYSVRITTESNELSSGEVTEDEKIDIHYKYSIPYVPKGFSYVGGTWDTGLVISDNSDDKSVLNRTLTGDRMADCKGNLYVWIPVVNYSDEYTWGVDYNTFSVSSETDYYNIKNALQTYTSTYVAKTTGYSDAWYKSDTWGMLEYKDSTSTTCYYTNGNIESEEKYNELYNKCLTSIYKYGGFYIGAYEMGIEVADNEEKANEISRTSESIEYIGNDTTNATNTAPSIIGMKAPLSRANAIPYNFITQSQANMLANNLKENSNYSNLNSSILFGLQWDIVCVFIEKFDTNNTAPNDSKSQWLTNSEYSKLWGNYRLSSYKMNRGFYMDTTAKWKSKNNSEKTESTSWMCTTGASDQNSSLNIYDFGGNLVEWTLVRPTNVNTPNVRRGGWYSGSANYAYATWISGHKMNTFDEICSTRVSLYK